MIIPILVIVICLFYIMIAFTSIAIAENNNSVINKRQKMAVKKLEDVEETISGQPINPVALVDIKHPDFGEAKVLFERAFKCQTQEDFNGAINLYSNAMLMCPEIYEPYYNMALCYKKLHNKSDAIKYFEKAALLNRFYKPIFFNLGKLYSEQSNEAKAAANWAIYDQM